MAAGPARLLHEVKDDATFLGWDQIAPYRDRQLRQGVDISYHQVLVPEVMRLVGLCGNGDLLDAGCGTGVLTEQLAHRAVRVTGVDISPVSIAIAEASASKPANVDYCCRPIHRFPQHLGRGHSYETIVANMVLMDVIALDEVLAAMHELLAPGGALVATITHPCFWPAYWGYGDALWFNYYREQVIAHPFVTHTDRTAVTETVHVHRPLERYVRALIEGRFRIDEMAEPLPQGPVPQSYFATLRRPRFLSFLARKAV